MNTGLWNSDVETRFFVETLKHFASPSQIFYSLAGEYYAYIPKGVKSDNQTLQSRNALIGSFTEKWCRDIFEPIATRLGLHAVNGVICNELGLTQKSSADLALCTSADINQKPEGIKLLFEIKMSIVSNYKYINNSDIRCIGDFQTHKGQPSLLRSDSMLKAIGKAINIRVSGSAGNKIPIIVLGNSPIATSYLHKVDALLQAGVVQRFLSLYPDPCPEPFTKCSSKGGFQTINTVEQLGTICSELVNNQLTYFSAMISNDLLGKYIALADLETTNELKAQKFFDLLGGAKL